MNFLDKVLFTATEAPLPTLPPVEQTSPQEMWNWFEQFIPALITFGKRIFIAILIFLIGKKILKGILKVLDKSFQRSNMEEGVNHFLLSLGKGLGYAILVVIIADYIGVGTSSILALVGSAGLAIGLALQGSLSNFAGGVLILLMKPFRIGDYIIALGNEGTVTGIDIFYTKLLTADNRLIVMPNGSLANASIVNVTNEPVRRLDLEVCIDYSENIKKVKDILSAIGQQQESILKDNDITIFVSSFDPSAIKLGMRVWVATEDYWNVKWDLHERIKAAFDENNIVIPFDQLDVNLTK